MPTSRVERCRKTLSRDGELDSEPEARRKKVRKGTHSCWECRRRKMKCIFGSPTDAACISCQRRGAKCVAQEFPEEISISLDRSLQMGDRMVRVETLVEQLLKKASNDSDCISAGTTTIDDARPIQGHHTSASTSSESLQLFSPYDPSVDTRTVNHDILTSGAGLPKSKNSKGQLVVPRKYEKLSRILHKSLPSPKDSDTILKARSNISTLFNQMLTVPYKDLDGSDLKSAEGLLARPERYAHPVFIARYMLHVATFLQHLHPDSHEVVQGLSEPPCEMMNRLADTAISLVTTNDHLVGSVEGLECIMVESLYQANGGNLRKGLIAIRRAMVVAQLMGFHKPESQAQGKVLDADKKAHPQFIWFRIVFAERHLCLMLGLPQGTLDQSMASKAMLAGDTPMGRLERVHCVVASRLLERNQSDPGSQDFALTQQLDAELQTAAEGLPGKWWLAANLATVVDKPQAMFWDMRRQFHQLFHYNLLNQLHLPYMMRSSPTGHKYDYSLITCVNASREVLSRFIMFRSFSRVAFCCRTIDFFALMAAMTLLLAHLDGHRRSAAALARSQWQGQPAARTENLLAHQRPADRAMIEQTQESMEEVNRLHADALSAQSAGLLRRLLAIESEAASGHAHRVNSVSVQAPHAAEELDEEPSEDSSGAVRVYIPYFGVINIAREGVISKEISINYGEGLSIETEGQRKEVSAQATAFGDDPIAAQIVLQTSSSASDVLFQQCEYPIATAGVDDWAFQGVDMAFFDSLMRGAGDDGDNGPVLPAWSTES
ncbi:dehydrocurvularin biosynthesis regulator [Colletotrichum liriopes]|uniref:Dehydrocurvularin biosynthesis regulator n=1 Tax=Colletotrichum liriopes TaxID=708192 RepID=A0AA37GWH2_9PEZI|nr:dehydrocurvularin biosynthesis regulator [Colletotrichum liriopes]